MTTPRFPILVSLSVLGFSHPFLAAAPVATPAADIRTLPGFEAQLLYSVPRDEQGSWVVLATDPKGRLYTSDQQKQGIQRITLDHTVDPPGVTIERLPIELSGAQGLTWAFDHLYANVSGRGLFRIRDSNGDDMLDTIEDLGGTKGGGEHGNHAVKPTADGTALYLNAGNFTRLPGNLATPQKPNWSEDLLLPRMWDAKGHAKGVLAPGGWIARINPDASEWHVVSTGYRNAYDFTLNHHGELFTWDSDMEWDMGMPWYRPTRLAHAVSGSDFGWRSGSGKWPVYYEDSLPPLIDIGPGSPTGMLSGAGAKFPAKYQHALYALDWTFGTIYAAHLTPNGASYNAELEEFLSGSPLALTSAVIGADGAMYFVTGGRNTQSGLYRVVYRGDESTTPAPDAPDATEAKAARDLRRSLEAYHHQENPAAIAAAWPHLDSGDRFIRHAARLAIEAQPVETWAARAIFEPRPQARATANAALARRGSGDHRASAILSVMEISPPTPEVHLAKLRALALIFIRLGEPADAEREFIADFLMSQFPSGDDRIDAELIRLLVYLKDSRVIEPALALMLDGRPQPVPDWGELIQRNSRYGGTIQRMLGNHPPTRAIDIAFMLRNLRHGWALDQRRAYFQFIIDAASYPGGASYTGFLKMIRDEALANTSDAERAALTDITGETLDAPPEFAITPPQGPGRAWTLEEANAAVDGHLRKRDFEAGRNHYFATSCAACHRFDGHGGNIGPDLSTVRNKFSTADLLEAIIDPSAAISDQYGTFQIKLKSGGSHIGIAVDRGESYLIHTSVIGAEPITVAKADVESITQLQISQMPPGLINTLNPNELRDLIAYMMSGGDPEHAMFK
jgi:putative heme-binding domain-containing protein